MGSSTVRDVGFSTLHDGGSDPQLDIVFIHGIQGHPYRTWAYDPGPTQPAKSRSKFLGIRSRSRASSQNREDPNESPPDPLSGLWPATILSRDFSTARILTYGYESRVSNFFGGAANQNDWVTIAGGFLNDLAAERVAARARPLIIVSHSMGGLITKEALRRASGQTERNADLRDIFESTTALVFFGTPHRGGAYTDLGLTAAKIAKAAGFDVFDQNIRNLKGDSPLLTLVRRDFLPLLDSDRFEVSTFQESLGFVGTGMLNEKIVPNESSALDHRNERVNPINANHTNMCRFKDADDDGYRKFKAEIARHQTRLQQGVQQNSFLIPEMSSRVDQILEAHAETLGWLYDEPGPGIASWLKYGSGVFWIQGKPGSGKSTAMKFMVHDQRTRDLLDVDAKRPEFNVVGCFFTDRGARVQASWIGILHSMVHQLISRNRMAAQIILPVWREALKRKAGDQRLWDIDALENILKVLKLEKSISLKVCFWVDAIDEHDGNHSRMCKFLHDICSLPSDTSLFKVCAASRPENDLRDLFRDDLTISVHEWTREDMQNFVSERMSMHSRWNTLLAGQGTAIAARIQKEIISRAEGVFLWVRLIIDELLDALTNGSSLLELETQSRKFPNDLDKFFAHMIKKIDKQYYAELYIIIETLLRHRGAPNAVLLQIVIRGNLPDLNKNATVPSVVYEGEFDKEGFSRRLQSRSRGLVELVNSSNGCYDVQFLHQTVKEYFYEVENLSLISEHLGIEILTATTTLSGHFFLIKGYQEWFQLRKTKQPARGEKFRLHGDGGLEYEYIILGIVSNARIIERELDASPAALLEEIDTAINEQVTSGDLWPFEACGMFPGQREEPRRITMAMKNYMASERLPQHHALFMVAIALGWLRYVELYTDSKAPSAIPNIGVRQFAYVCCPTMMTAAEPSVRSLKSLVNFGIDVTKCQDLGCGYQADALGFYISSHARCLPFNKLLEVNSDDGNDHYEAIQFLLEQGANPGGRCLYKARKNKEERGVGTIVELLISRFGLAASFSLVKLLTEYCPQGRSVLEHLFDTSMDKVLESEALEWHFDETTFIWLRDHGAYISKSLAMLIYLPFSQGLQHQSDDTQTYSQALKSLSEKGIPDPSLSLDRSLINLYEYELGGTICERNKFFLAPEQRKPEYYDAAARRFAAQYNPHWSSTQVTTESTSMASPSMLSTRYWRKFFSSEEI